VNLKSLEGKTVTLIGSSVIATTFRLTGKVKRVEVQPPKNGDPERTFLDIILPRKRKASIYRVDERTMVFQDDPGLRVDSDESYFRGNACINLSINQPIPTTDDAIRKIVETENLNPSFDKALLVVWKGFGEQAVPTILYPELARERIHGQGHRPLQELLEAAEEKVL
jgi:hypothetical protein